MVILQMILNFRMCSFAINLKNSRARPRDLTELVLALMALARLAASPSPPPPAEAAADE